MQLSQYPKQIAKLRKQVLAYDKEIEAYQLYIKQAESDADAEIAFDQTFKNDAQRKARRQDILNHREDYATYKQTLPNLKASREETFIDLCQLQDEFSVLKLERRERIAQLEMQSQVA